MRFERLTHLRQWPPSGGHCVESTKTASTYTAPELDLETLVGGIVSSMGRWEEPPAGIDKVAAAVADREDSAPITPQNVWRHPNAHPLVLMLLILDKYGKESLEWDSEVLRQTLQRDGIALSGSAWTKIQAARVMLMSPSPWRQWEVFHWTALGLAGQQPNFVYLEEPELGHLLVGIDLMRMVDPQRQTSSEVDKFLAGALMNEGVAYAPEPVGFAQDELEDKHLRCGNCGALQRDDDDITCVTCGSKELTAVPYEHAALRDGTKALFETLKKLPLEKAVAKLPETAEGNAAYRLLVHQDYLNQVRSHLRQQMRMLHGA